MSPRIYLDNAATTAMDAQVVQHVHELMKNEYGNPSSIHQDGRKARSIIEQARKSIAKGFNCSIGEIFFTSGGTESNNTIIKRSVSDLGVRKIIHSCIEHPCILSSVEDISERSDVYSQSLKVDGHGRIDLKKLEEILAESDDRTLVSIMHVNNEIGTINDIREIGNICKSYDAYFHTDAVQSVTHLPIDLQDLQIDFLTGSSHKFHGPKGVGFFYMNADSPVKPYLSGGGQERNMRSGTENFYGIAGMELAYNLGCEERVQRQKKISSLKQQLKDGLLHLNPNVTFNGDQEFCIPKILSVGFPPHPKGEALIMLLDMNGISVSGGSACSSGSQQPSHVIQNIAADPDFTNIRFSISHYNTEEDINKTLESLNTILNTDG